MNDKSEVVDALRTIADRVESSDAIFEDMEMKSKMKLHNVGETTIEITVHDEQLPLIIQGEDDD